MAEGIDSEYHTQFTSFVEPGHDLELEPMDTFYLQVPDNTSTWTDSNYESNFSNDALASQYSYPLPPVANTHRPHSYPDPSAQTTEQIAPYYAPNNVDQNTVRTPHFSSTEDMTIAPSQISLPRGKEPTYAPPRTRDGRRVQDEVRKNTQPPARSRRQSTTPYQSPAYTQPPKKPQRAIRPTPDLFRDGSTPYVPGYTTRQESELQNLTDTMAAVVERPSFACDECGKPCKSKSDLNHHRVIHDPDKMNRHKCQLCDAAFLYPKDLKRHCDAKHSKIEHACADCDKVYKRRDHLERHMKTPGHIATAGAVSLVPASPISPATSTNAYDESIIGGASPPDSQTRNQSYGYAAQLHTFNQRSLSRLNPSLLHSSPFSSASFTTGSIDDTFTVSKPNSFWSEEF